MTTSQARTAEGGTPLDPDEGRGGGDGVEAALRARLATLPVDRKVRLLTGADSWGLRDEPAAGLRRVTVSDGPVGVRGTRWDERDPSANLPSPTALAATWDPALVERLGGLLAGEARRKGVDVVLAPTVNLHRTPFGGRHFECFSEDPLLTAVVGGAYVRGLQAAGVAATVKHVVANDSETERLTVDVRVDERTLRELYLAPFEAIVAAARPWALMAAYNRVNGTTMTEHPLLRDVVAGEWGFDGVVVSDWYATHSTVESARAALDLVMPGPGGPWGDALVAAVRDGSVPEAVVDDKVLRLLRLAARVGALDGIDPVTPPARPWPPAEVATTLRGAAAAGFVLARNEVVRRSAGEGNHEVPGDSSDSGESGSSRRSGGSDAGGDALLPLDRAALRHVAVVGPNAAVPRTLGGGSATVFPPYTVSPLDGLRAALGPGVRVDHARGVRLRVEGRVPVADPILLRPPGEGWGPGTFRGVEVRFLAADGTVLGHERRHAGLLWWDGGYGPGIPADLVTAVEAHATLRAGAGDDDGDDDDGDEGLAGPGDYVVGCSGLGRFRITLDGAVAFDGALAVAEGTDPVDAFMRPPQHAVTVTLAADQAVDLVVRHDLTAGRTHTGTRFQVNLDPPHPSDDDELATAVAAAAGADVAVVVVGTTEEVESEGFDRTDLALPGRQDELVRRVAAANARTVVVVNAGAPVWLPWADDVATVLLAWFPGQEFGTALADVLLGTVEPGGRLPTTWPATGDGLPSTQPVDGVLAYDEGLAVGYRDPRRAGPATRYPFGHGLGYTTWEYLDLRVDGRSGTPSAAGAAEGAAPSGEPSPTAATGLAAAVSVRVRNTGIRHGREVVQLYAARPDGSIPRPPRWLVGFAAVEAGPGEEAVVTIDVPARALAHWDTGAHAWVVEPGKFRLAAGRSSADLPLAADLTFGGT